MASLAMIAVYFLPVWSIYLVAPQYPEGLSMQIWLYQITGQVEIINGLNHYIGMKHIKEEMFPEFSYLSYVLGFYILAGLAVAAIGKRKLLTIYLVLLVAAGALAMYDYYQWGYDYGHNLDPTAAIQVPGMTYQPPLIGHKTLLNFDAYSYPDSGGWVVIGAAALFFAVWLQGLFNRKRRSVAAPSLRTGLSTAAMIALLLSSCTTEPQPFAIGKDLCDDCKMTIMDPKFGGELLTKKGRIYKFDDIHCMANFLNESKVAQKDIAQTLVINFKGNQQFLNAKEAHFLVSEKIKSPMGSNTAAFADKAAAGEAMTQTGGQMKSWDELLRSL